jgi:hypothetical protein
LPEKKWARHKRSIEQKLQNKRATKMLSWRALIYSDRASVAAFTNEPRV